MDTLWGVRCRVGKQWEHYLFKGDRAGAFTKELTMDCLVESGFEAEEMCRCLKKHDYSEDIVYLMTYKVTPDFRKTSGDFGSVSQAMDQIVKCEFLDVAGHPIDNNTGFEFILDEANKLDTIRSLREELMKEHGRLDGKRYTGEEILCVIWEILKEPKGLE